MTEVLSEYDTVLSADDGSRWIAQACGRPGETMWEGWIEFVPLDAGLQPLRSRRETTQPSRQSLTYWATGLTPVYLKGALDRTLAGPPRHPVARRVAPLFDRPAPEMAPAPEPPAGAHPILDPFDVYMQGEQLLTRQLDALDLPHLRDIAVAYEIVSAPQAATARRAELTTAIVAAARSAATRV